jgi:hypothetical protein
MIDLIKTYFKYVLLHRWNKVGEEHFDWLDNHWQHKPSKGLRLWLYNKVKNINKGTNG